MKGSLEKDPLTARCDSSGSDDMTSGRDTPSPYSQLERGMMFNDNAAESSNHEYADPTELKDDIAVELEKIDGARKKRNLIYESSQPTLPQKTDKIDGNRNKLSPRRRSGSDETLILSSNSLSSSGKSKRTCMLQYLCIAIFVIGLVALSMAIYTLVNKSIGADPISQQIGKNHSFIIAAMESYVITEIPYKGKQSLTLIVLTTRPPDL